MAHSFITYQKKSVMLKDAKVFLAIGLIRHAAQRESQNPIQLAIDNWFFGYDEFPSGAIDLQLDALLSNPVSLKFLRRCCDSALETVNSKGPTLSGEWLSEVLNDGEPFSYKDRATCEVAGVLEKFRSLLY